MKGTYDNVAPFYDFLSQLVFKDAILQAHIFLANAVPAGSSVLVVGGGTGKLLEEITTKNQSGLQITYVDISKKMIRLSKKRNTRGNSVSFINQSITDVSFHQQFDVVITPFLFDNFSTNTTKVVFDKIDPLLKPGALWLFADFEQAAKNNLWQKFLLKLMYLFFRIACGIEASNLPDTASLFQKCRYAAVAKETFYKGFIYSVIYRKPVNYL
jgi:ubiquinone/menaquinone biosynthesis C-methylase UbiE